MLTAREHTIDDYMKQQLEQIKKYPIYLYGAGSFGKEMCLFLEQNGKKIEGFLDKRAEEQKEYCGYPVYSLEENSMDKTEAVVLLAIVMDKDARKSLVKQIKAVGYKRVEEAQFYRSLMIVPDDAKEKRIELQDYIWQRREKIESVYDLFADKKSRGIYEANLKAHFLKDYKDCARWEDTMEEQYFPKDIPLAKGYRRFVDCGGFTGDTVKKLLGSKKDIEAVISYEPDRQNFKMLSKHMNSYACEMICFPCAVSEKTDFQRFHAARGSGALCEDGNDRILSVSLDETLPHFRPTFIKMDIEGAEKKALKGAKKIICEDIPDLAICVYHHMNHIWDIAWMLNSWNLGYQFYLRSYNAYTMETVLYATVGEK